jgi:hypothetical protein
MTLRICFVLLFAMLLGAAPASAQLAISEPPEAPLQIAQAVGPPPMPPAPSPVCPEVGVRGTQLALYGWLAGIDADLSAGPVTRPLDISFSDILSHLDMTFMGYYETGRGKTGFFLNTVYVRLSGDESLPVETFNWEVTQWLVDGGVIFYGGTSERGLDGLIGGRYLNLSNDLSLSPSGIGASESSSWLMPIIGGRYRATFTPQWSGTLEADIGGISGDTTWQAVATLRYRYNETTFLGIGYRYLHLNLEEGNVGFDGAMSGPLLGVGWEM